MICDLTNIKEKLDSEGLTLLIVSYGGSCSNTFADLFEKNNYICRTDTYCKILCHCPEFIECDIPIIYIYDNPIKSFMSMKNRGDEFWDVNQQKLSNNTDVLLSDENLLKLMIKQFNSWTNIKRNNVLVINSSEIFEHNIVNKLENFLNTKINHFPIEYVKPKSDINNISDKELIDLFEKYKYEIDKINNFVN